MLNIRKEIPPEFFQTQASGLKDLLAGPTLFNLDGLRPSSLFVSVLLHGNETSGFEAVKQVLQKYTVGGGSQTLPRKLQLFIGNVDAAKEGKRHLDGQPDYNRIWPGGSAVDSAEKQMMEELVNHVKAAKPFASIDFHNNTGINPHYACINKLDDEFLYLATLFSRTVVYFAVPKGVQSLCFAEFCPAVTLECGQSGDLVSLEHAIAYFDACLHMQELPKHTFPSEDIDLYHTVASIKIPAETSFSFDGSKANIMLDPAIEKWNFRELNSGTMFCKVSGVENFPFELNFENKSYNWQDYFELKGSSIFLKRTVMPSMLTLDKNIVRQDCLCYLMENLYPHGDTMGN